MRPGLVVVTFALFAAACGDNHKAANDAGADGGGNTAVEMFCATLPPVTAGTCEVTAGTAGNKTTLLKGNVLTSAVIYQGGQVAIDGAGKIACVGCNCAAGGETTISCPDASISPGLINTHDHITYTHNDPYLPTGAHAAERYDDRQQWRTGKGTHYAIPYKSGANADQVRWGELRFVMGGATSIVGSGGQAGLLRNLDQSAANQEGLAHKAVNFDTFPLDDADGTQRTGDCNYGAGATKESDLAALDAYEPHTSEGINAAAHNEFLCESSASYDTMTPGVSHNLLISKTAMIHAIGLQPADYGAMANAGTGLIWSPRSNLTLYGETARVTTAARLGVEIALGTDWMPSGSMNLLRELACADSFNATYLGHYFSDQQLWEMVTINAASVTATSDAIGALAAGKTADIAIFAAHGKPVFRAVIEAEPKDVTLVIRGGKVLYGDDAVVAALAQTCDTVDVCGTAKRVCTMAEVGKTYDALKAAANVYPAFTCGVPQDEPSCTPVRPLSVDGSTVYTGMTSAADSDGDGIPDASDKCPHVFDPVRPMDSSAQGDADNDGEGDACDPCPLDASSTQCTVVDPNDRDHDGVANATDNCPDVSNADQADGDHDGKGDVCDACPADANMGSAGCPKTIYQIKTGMAPVGLAVHVTNALVTGRGSNGFFVQVKEGDAGYIGPDNSGLFVFTSTAPQADAAVGTRVTLDGTIANFQGQIELDQGTRVTVTSAVVEPPPAPAATTYAEIKTGGPRAASLESVIVSLAAATVTAVDTMLVEFTLTDAASNTLIVDDFLFALPAPPINQAVTAVTGILALRQSVSKLEPRAAADLTLGAPALKALTPALSFARVGTTSDAPTFPVPLTVTLTGPAQGNTTVALTSGDPLSLTVTDVVIPDGAISAQVHVTAVAAAAAVPVTATLAGQTATANVRVLAADEAPLTVTLSPATSSIAPRGTAQLTATLDVPALVTTTVALSLAPATAGTLPATVDIAPGATSATFAYTDTASTTATITATFLASTSTATVTVTTAPDHPVLSQVFGAGGNAGSVIKSDFMEIHNPTAATVTLTGWSVQYASATGTGAWTVTPLVDAASNPISIPPGGYVLVAEALGNGGTVDLPTPDVIGTIPMGGGAGKVALVSSTTALNGQCPTAGVIDQVGYGAANCSEGAPTPGLTSTTAAVRLMAGCTDTNNNLADFATLAPAPRNKATPAFICP